VSVWFAIPSARPDGGTVALWKRRGYRVALWRDQEGGVGFIPDWVTVAPYPGYAQAVNHLVKTVLAMDPECEWCVAGGDDTEPDLNHSAEQIALECDEHFGTTQRSEDAISVAWDTTHGTFGVMQPTGDRFAGGCIDRICGSPWMGREFCQRMNGGQGPFWPEYRHMFVDEELQNVALKLGVLWQRPDLIHLHHHFQRESDAVESNAVYRPVPAHLVEANSPAHWDKYKALFEQRKAAGFPGCEPLASVGAGSGR